VGDAHRINQILINLLGNALKFTREGGISIIISYLESGEAANGKVRIHFTIQDTGIGIDTDKQALIFETFTQADNSTVGEFGGSGLGLSIVKQLIGLMEGTIEAKTPNRPISDKGGTGTLFEFEIPFSVCTVCELPKMPVTAVNGDYAINDLRILVAEDNLINQKLALYTISTLGCKATIAHNGQDAIKKLVQQEFDLVLMDVLMPVMDGLEATKIIRSQLNSTIPIIGLTANAFKEDKEACFAAGMNDHLSKPYSPEHLKQIIVKWSSRSLAEAC
jgi:CheY-like chemotaxis protein